MWTNDTEGQQRPTGLLHVQQSNSLSFRQGSSSKGRNDNWQLWDNGPGSFLFWWRYVDRAQMCPETEFGTMPPAVELYFDTYLPTGTLYVSQTSDRTPAVCYLLNPTGSFLSEWAKCRPGNTQNGRTVLPIANLMADSESESPDSYSTFLVAIRLPRLVSDRQTDRRTAWTITKASSTLWRVSWNI